MGYNTKLLATGEAEVRNLLEEFRQDPTKAKLMYDTNSGESIDPSEPTAGSAGVHLATRAPVSHFAALLRGRTVDKLVRVTLFHQEEFGQLVALGPDGFFLCTCLRQLVYGLVCPHGLKAMVDNQLKRFNGASFAPRWRDTGTPWSLEDLAAKPAMLSAVDANEASLQPPPFDLNTDAISHSGANVKAAAYANGVSFGKDMGVLLRDLDSLAAIDRVLESTKVFFRQQLEGEKRSQRNSSTSRVFTGVVSTPPASRTEMPGGRVWDGALRVRHRGVGAGGHGEAGAGGDGGAGAEGPAGGGQDRVGYRRACQPLPRPWRPCPPCHRRKPQPRPPSVPGEWEGSAGAEGPGGRGQDGEG